MPAESDARPGLRENVQLKERRIPNIVIVDKDKSDLIRRRSSFSSSLTEQFRSLHEPFDQGVPQEQVFGLRERAKANRRFACKASCGR
jgi:hypothetical protein